MWRRVLAVAVIAVAVAAAALALLVRGDAPVIAVQSSSGWVPFRAGFRQLRNGELEAAGRYARHHDGSTLRETSSPAGDTRFITIVNVPEGRFYSFAGGTWTVQPLILRRARHLPDRRADSQLVGVVERVGGLRLVRETTATGAVLLRAPALDFFPVIEQHPEPPMRRELFDIVVEPVDASWFFPPAGARVDRLPWPYVID